jgi:uncharacterized membrane protein YphA (DoxX/SURF4 family)
MHTIFVIGRVLFVVIFIVSGAQKLLDIQGTAAMIAPAITLPDAMSDITTQIQEATGQPLPQLMAIVAGIIELVGGLLIAFNIGTRGAALVLALFTIAATFYFHDFWNMAGEARANNIVHAMKNISIIGGLLVFFVLGSWRPLTRSERVV